MDQLKLHRSSRLAETEWLAPRLATFGSAVRALSRTRRLPSLSRILHPRAWQERRGDPIGPMLQSSRAAQCTALYSFTPSIGRLSLFRRFPSPPGTRQFAAGTAQGSLRRSG